MAKSRVFRGLADTHAQLGHDEKAEEYRAAAQVIDDEAKLMIEGGRDRIAQLAKQLIGIRLAKVSWLSRE